MARFYYDFDNTLFLTSEADKVAGPKAFGTLFAEHGLDIDYNKHLRGKDIGDVCDYVEGRYGLALDEDDVRQRFRQAFFDNLDLVRPTTGAVEVVRALHEAGHAQYIATNSPMARVERSIEHYDARVPPHLRLEPVFGGRIFTAFDNFPQPRKKPRPDVYIHAVGQTAGIDTHEDVFFIEDSITGLASAVAAREFLASARPRLSVSIAGMVGDRVMMNEDDAKAEFSLMQGGVDFCMRDMRNLWVRAGHLLCDLPQILQETGVKGNTPKP